MPTYRLITLNVDQCYYEHTRQATVEDFVKIVNDALSAGATLVGGVSTSIISNAIVIYTQAVMLP